MNQASDIHRSKPRFDPEPRRTLFDWILWPLKAVLGSWVLFFAFIVLVMVVMAALHFSRPRVYELEIDGLPGDVLFVALVDEAGTDLIEHNFPWQRLGGTIDQERPAVESWASYLVNHERGEPIILPLDGKPASANGVLILRSDGRLQRAGLEGLEGSWARWQLDLAGRDWRDCEPESCRQLGVLDLLTRMVPSKPR